MSIIITAVVNGAGGPRPPPEILDNLSVRLWESLGNIVLYIINITMPPRFKILTTVLIIIELKLYDIKIILKTKIY